MMSRLVSVWRKHEPELRAWICGSIPAFIRSREIQKLDGVPVFCYHTVSRDGFADDLRYLRVNGYRTLSAAEFLDVLEGRCAIPDRAVLLTFDDGPRNFHDVALPELLRFSSRAIAFVAPGLHPDHMPASLASSPDRPMSWHELERVHASGVVDLESHTLHSRYVPRWPQPAPLAGVAEDIEAALRGSPLPLKQDLIEAKRLLESRLPAKRVLHLAFPMYDGTYQAVETAWEAGYRALYWGWRPGGRLAGPETDPGWIPRVPEVYLRSLPGSGRDGLRQMLARRASRIRPKSPDTDKHCAH